MLKEFFERHYYIWGIGKYTEDLLVDYADILNEINVIGYIDNDCKKQNMMHGNKHIYSPAVLTEDREAYIIIHNTYRDEIIEQIGAEYPWYNDRIIEDNFKKRFQLLIRYRNTDNPEINETLEYLCNHELQNFNYSFSEKYNNVDDFWPIFFDESCGLYYVMAYKKRMYMSRKYDTREKVEAYCRLLQIEQDEKSPHKYYDANEINELNGEEIVVDAGVAEGNFSLGIVDKVKKIYMFEPDADWVEALKYTFIDYADKVVLIEKCVSNFVNNGTTTIDEIVEDEKVDIIKMDIEGEELYALKGSEKVLKRSDSMRCYICTYHQEFAYEVISNYMKEKGFDIYTRTGYIWYVDHSYRAPVLRRGLIEAIKNK